MDRRLPEPPLCHQDGREPHDEDSHMRHPEENLWCPHAAHSRPEMNPQAEEKTDGRNADEEPKEGSYPMGRSLPPRESRQPGQVYDFAAEPRCPGIQGPQGIAAEAAEADSSNAELEGRVDGSELERPCLEGLERTPQRCAPREIRACARPEFRVPPTECEYRRSAA